MNSQSLLFSPAEEYECFHNIRTLLVTEEFFWEKLSFPQSYKDCSPQSQLLQSTAISFFLKVTLRLDSTQSAKVQLIWDYCHVYRQISIIMLLEILICKISDPTSEIAHKKGCSQLGISVIHNMQLNTMQENIYGKTSTVCPIPYGTKYYNGCNYCLSSLPINHNLLRPTFTLHIIASHKQIILMRNSFTRY